MASTGRYGRDLAGISNHPLDEERDRQNKVPPRGKAEDGPTRAGKRRVLFEQDDQDSTFTTKSAKGGKTGGSRAGLAMAGRKVGTKGRGQ